MSPAKSWSGAKQCFHSESVNPRLGSTETELTSVSFIPRPSAQPHPDASQALAQRQMPKPVDELPLWHHTLVSHGCLQPSSRGCKAGTHE